MKPRIVNTSPFFRDPVVTYNAEITTIWATIVSSCDLNNALGSAGLIAEWIDTVSTPIIEIK